MKWQEMKWSWVKQLKSDNLIEEFENMIGYTFPEDYKECVRLNNGGAPELEAFDVKNEYIGTTGFGYLYSFNKDDISSIWNLYEWDECDDDQRAFIGRYIPFTSSAGGDPVCFDTTNNHVVFIDHETLEVEELANSFSAFIEMLYEG